MAQIFGKLFAWLANDVIIHTLSNSKRFQQFALRTDATLSRHKETLKNHVVAPGEEILKAKAADVKQLDLNAFMEMFKQEMSKEMAKSTKKLKK